MSETQIPKKNDMGSAPLIPTWFRLCLPVVLDGFICERRMTRDLGIVRAGFEPDFS